MYYKYLLSFTCFFYSLLSFDEQQLLTLIQIIIFKVTVVCVLFKKSLPTSRNLCLLQYHEATFLYFTLEDLLFYPLHLSLKWNDYWRTLLLGNCYISFHLGLLIIFLNILSFYALISIIILLIHVWTIHCQQYIEIQLVLYVDLVSCKLGALVYQL